MNGRGWQATLLVLALIFTGCAQQPTPTPTPAATPLPAIGLDSRSGAARASGEIVPARRAALSFPAAGRVQVVAVDVGDAVETGAVLAALDGTAAEATAMQARAALFRAQALVAELRAGARPQEIAAAQARLDAVQAHLAQLTEGARAEEVAATQSELAAAQAAYRQLFGEPRPEERISALAVLSNAEAALRQAQAAYDQVAWRNDVAMLPQSRQLQEATNNYEAAQARYDALYADPDPDLATAAQARVQRAQAALDRLQAPATESQIAEAEAQVRGAQAELDLLTVGARDETLAAAVAAVSEAESVFQRAQADLDNTELRAPFAGTVTALTANQGEMVLPGQEVLVLADLESLQAETTDLSERDVARVAVGQPAIVVVAALGAEIPGRVARIAPQATVIGGDVVYTVVVELEEQPPGLRWGMSVDVEILAE